MIKPHRVLGATAVTLVALSVSACGGGDANQPAKPPAPAPAATVTVTPPPNAPNPLGAGAAGGAGGATKPCQPADFKLEVDAGPRATPDNSQDHLILALKNISNRACTVNGLPDVELDGPDDPVNGRAYQLPSTEAKAKPLTVQPGKAVGSDLSYLRNDDDPTGGWIPNEVLVTPPGSKTWIRAPWPVAAGSVLRQDGATHPGTFYGPLTPIS